MFPVHNLNLLQNTLLTLYPDAVCALDYQTPWQLLVASRLSAQCTDKRVNIVTKDLFKTYPTIESTCQSTKEEIENIIRPCGLGNTKARDIVAAAHYLTEHHGGEIPDNMAELLKIPGVGRKIANLLLGDLFRKPAIVVDTHFMRIVRRVGLTKAENPAVIEREMKELFIKAGLYEQSSDFCHRIVWFGRDVCDARKPKCEGCLMKENCKYYFEK
jgi:Predicted EndoIII-related endonuclease